MSLVFKCPSTLETFENSYKASRILSGITLPFPFETSWELASAKHQLRCFVSIDLAPTAHEQEV